MNTKRIYKNEDGYRIVDAQLLEYFPTLNSLENHLKLLLSFVQETKENTVDRT